MRLALRVAMCGLVAPVLAVGAPEAGARPDMSTAVKRAVLRMPFSGGGDTGIESPTKHHHFFGGYAWDLHKTPGAEVRANVVSSDGKVSLVVGTVVDTDRVGFRVPVTVKVGSTTVGTVRFEHLVNVKVSSGATPKPGDLLGYLSSATYKERKCSGGIAYGFPYIDDGWEVCTKWGIHAHVEFRQACWRKGLGTHVAVGAKTGIAMLSSAYASANRGACDNAQMDAVNSEADTEPPTRPTSLTASATASAMKLAWRASADNVGVRKYELSRNGAVVGTTTSTSYTSKNLKCGTSYTFHVRAYDAAGNKSASAGLAAATTECSTPQPAPPPAATPRFELVAERVEQGWDIHGLTAAPDGTIWLLEKNEPWTRARVVSVAPDGHSQTYPLPRHYQGPPKVVRPTGSTVPANGTPDPVVDAAGAIWYLNNPAGTLGRISGASRQEFPLPIIAGELALAANGRDIWILGIVRVRRQGHNEPHAVVLRMAPTGRVLQRTFLNQDRDPSGICWAIAAGFDGRAWIACGDTILAISTTGRVTTYQRPEVPKRCLDQGIWEIARGRTTLWFAGPNAACGPGDAGFLGTISSKGRTRLFKLRRQSLGTPQVLVRGPRGQMWFTSGGGVPYIGHATDSGVVDTYVLPTAITGESRRSWISVGLGSSRDGELLVRLRLFGGLERVFRMTLG